eukprot:gnl/Trimastix_PCT/1492.p1 GENE.gnl/Trimastix_PCT/1492~~gnl/Trimastix_PCT/1492.p1  ORF type:complete len:393 (+),score=106.90 gnl/Trimastix_PCT/1492:65-1180(+)
MDNYWIVSVPGQPTPNDSYRNLHSICGNHAQIFKFDIPGLRVGQFDTLLSLSDSLGRIDGFAEQVTHKIEKQFYELTKKTDPPTVAGAPLEQSLMNFQWDPTKYLWQRTPLNQLVDRIAENLSQIEENLKQRISDFSVTKGSITSMQRKTAGSLAVRSLTDIVTEEDSIETENITTLFVVVPKFLYREWETKYETLTDMIVPRSSRIIEEDAESGLYCVSLFKRVADEFKQKARDLRFTVRDFAYDADSVTTSHEEKARLETQFQQQWAEFLRWSRTNYGEAMQAWMHLKAIRCFVESVLRFGPSVEFCSAVIKIRQKSSRKVLENLTRAYRDVGAAFATGSTMNDDDEEYRPFVFLNTPLYAAQAEHRTL